MLSRLNILRAAFFLLFAGSAAVCLFVKPSVETSLFALVGEQGFSIPACVRDRGAAQIQVLVEGTTAEQARRAADSFYAALDKTAFESIRYKTDSDRLGGILEFYKAHGVGLVSDDDRGKLQESGRLDFFTQRAIRNLYGSLVPSLFPFAQDSFGLLDGFVRSLPLSYSGWKLDNGVLTADDRGKTVVLMALTLPARTAGDIDQLAAIVDSLKAKANAVQDAAVSFCGVPMHTAEVAGRCKRDINILACISLAFILGLGYLVFRSFKPLGLMLFSLTFSALGATLALALFFHPFHLLACLFGTTLLGLIIDYSFHWLLERGRALVSNLLMSYFTTELSFLPLVFSGIAILAQMAVFMGAGLTVALLCILLFYPEGNGQEQTRVSKGVAFLPKAFFFILFSVLVCLGLPLVRVHTDIDTFHRPSAALLAAEKKFRELSGETGKGLLVVSGDSLEQVLETEEGLNVPATVPHLSRFLPSLRQRTANAALVQSLYASQADALAKKLKLAAPPRVGGEPSQWQEDAIPSELVSSFLMRENGKVYSIIPGVAAPKSSTANVTFYAPREMLSEMMNHFARITLRMLAGAGALLAILLALVYRRRVVVIALPSLMATAAVFAGIALCGETVNLFHLLACFMLIGMSLDYTIFFASNFTKAQMPVLCSFLTSLVGFGALVFVPFPLVRSIGETLGIGLTVAYVSAYVLCARADVQGSEQGASMVGLEAAWLVYRVFGKCAVDLLGRAIAWCIWQTHAKVRETAGNSRRLFMFTQTLIDKLVVMANGRGQPIVEMRGDEDGRMFERLFVEKKGMFIISSHLGSIEILAARSRPGAKLHAFMKVDQTATFNRFYARHCLARVSFEKDGRAPVVIHPVENGLGIGSAIVAGDLLDAGDCILMAGDRGYGRMATMDFLGKPTDFPVGVFKFAQVMEHPVFFLVCVKIGRNRYEIIARRAKADGTLMAQFVAFLEPLVRQYPEQWFNWGV